MGSRTKKNEKSFYSSDGRMSQEEFNRLKGISKEPDFSDVESDVDD